MIFGWQRLRRAGQACNPGGNSFMAPQAGQVVAYEVGEYNGRRCATNVRLQSVSELLGGAE